MLNILVSIIKKLKNINSILLFLFFMIIVNFMISKKKKEIILFQIE